MMANNSNHIPHTQECGRTSGAPRQRPADIRTVALLSILRSTDEMGSACNQFPDPGEHDARRRA